MLSLFLAVWRSSQLGMAHILSPRTWEADADPQQFKASQGYIMRSYLKKEKKNTRFISLSFVKCTGQLLKFTLVYLSVWPLWKLLTITYLQLFSISVFSLGALTVLSSLPHQEMNVHYYQQTPDAVCLSFLSYHLIPNPRHLRNNGYIEALSLEGTFLLNITFCHLFILIILQPFISFCLKREIFLVLIFNKLYVAVEILD